MTEFTIREFLTELERTAGAAEQDEQALLNSEVGLTRPRFTADQFARSAARIAQRAQSLKAKAQSHLGATSRPATPTPAPVRQSAPPPRPAGPKFCTKCGDQRQADKRFCTKCGTQY